MRGGCIRRAGESCNGMLPLVNPSLTIEPHIRFLVVVTVKEDHEEQTTGLSQTQCDVAVIGGGKAPSFLDSSI